MSDLDSDSEEHIRVLRDQTLGAVAEYIKSEECKNVFIMVGAGMSVSAGIPDFRSPKTGLYANMKEMGLPYPEAVFQLSFFKDNPKPFYTFAKDFDPSIFRPTIAHSFITLLHKKGLLRTCFTQNIDGLEERAHLPAESLVQAHGSISSQHCVECQREAEAEPMWASIRKGEVYFCQECNNPVKPDIVFFGEALPKRFLEKMPELQEADLLLIFGTSLTVHPFASLAYLVDQNTPRVLFNLEEAGDIGSRLNDVLVLDECDNGVRDLCCLLGWSEDLEKEWATTALLQSGSDGVAVNSLSKQNRASTGTEHAEDMVDKLANDIAGTLRVDDPTKIESQVHDAVVSASVGEGADHKRTESSPLGTEGEGEL